MTKDQIVVADGSVFSADPRLTGLNNNVVICGTSGCGKTVSVTEANLLHTFDSSLVVTLSKRRLVDDYVQLFQQRGYQTEVLDLVDPGKGTIGYDPLWITKTSDDVRHLAKFICQSSADRNTDPYWVNATESLLVSILSAGCYPFQGGGRMEEFLQAMDSFRFWYEDEPVQKGEGYVQFNNHMITTIDEMMEKIVKLDEKSPLMAGWNSFKSLPDRTAGCIYNMIISYLSEYQSGAIRKSISMQRKFDPLMLAQNKTILFIVSSPVNKSSLRAVNMLYDQILKNLFEFAENRRDRVLPIPVRMICDDFATGGKIENFDEQISIFREKKLSVTLLLQSESQLEAMYGSGKATTIINNCDTYVYMGGTDLQTANSISKRTDTPLQDILGMPLGEVYVMRRGSKPCRTRRYDTYHDPEYTAFQKTLDEAEKTRDSIAAIPEYVCGKYGKIRITDEASIYAVGWHFTEQRVIRQFMLEYGIQDYRILNKEEAAKYISRAAKKGRGNVDFVKYPKVRDHGNFLLAKLDVHDVDKAYRRYRAACLKGRVKSGDDLAAKKGNGRHLKNQDAS